MNKGFMFNTTVATIQHRTANGGASPARDDVTNGNGNGNGHVDADASKNSKKKKKNKKRNSRASLTSEGDADGGEDEEETASSAAPSPVEATNGNESAVAEEMTPDVAWSSPAKDDVSAELLDLPSPAPVSSGSPFDVFDSLSTTATSSDAFSPMVMPPSTPAADLHPAMDTANLFAAPAQSPVVAPAQSPVRRAPPPPPPVPFVVGEVAQLFASAAPPSPPSPELQAVPPSPPSPLLQAATPSPPSPVLQAAAPSPPSPVLRAAAPLPPSPVLQAAAPSPPSPVLRAAAPLPPSPVMQAAAPSPPSPELRAAAPSPPSPVLRAAAPSPPSPVLRAAAPSPPSSVLRAAAPLPPSPVLQAAAPSPPSPVLRAVAPSPPSPVLRAAAPSPPSPLLRAAAPSPPSPVLRAAALSLPSPVAPAQAMTFDLLEPADMATPSSLELASEPVSLPAVASEPDPVVASPVSEPVSPTFSQEDIEPVETLTMANTVHSDVYEEAATTTDDTTTMEAFVSSSEIKNDGTAGALEVQPHLDSTIDTPAEAPSPRSPVQLAASIEVDSLAESDALLVAPKTASPLPTPVQTKAHSAKSPSKPSAKSPSTAVRSTKLSSNGASTAGLKPAGTKPSVSTRQATIQDTANATAKVVPKTTAPRTPTKQAPKPPMTSPSTAPVATKAATSRTPILQRSLSGSAAVKKPARSPTSSSATAAKSGSSSPTAPSPAAGVAEPKTKKKLSASEIDAAGNRLYEQAMESKRRLEAKKALREEEFTFTPQVNAKSKKLDNGDAPNRFVLLHERAKEAQRKKEELREKLEKEQCTFKPQITNKAKKIASSSDKPRHETLYRNAQEIQAKREEKKQELQKNEEELTFKPKIKAAKSPVRSRPLYDEELVKQRRLEREQKKLEAEQLAKPKVVKKVKAQDGDNSFFDRLHQAGLQRAERLAKLKQERDEQEMASTTFQPKVSSAKSITKTSSQPFHQRLFDKDYLKKVAAEREQKKLEEEKRRFSFKPRVSEMPDSVKSKGSSDGGSTGKSSIFERLYQDKDRVKEKIDLSEELKIQKEMEECTFRPQIDPPASAGGSKGESATPIWERLLSIDKNQIAEERDRLKAQQELEACTFRPEISGLAPGSVSPKRSTSSNIFDRLSTSAGNTPVDDTKRRPSERKSIAVEGKRSSYNEHGSSKELDCPRRVLSVGDILKSSPQGALNESYNQHVISEASSGESSAMVE